MKKEELKNTVFETYSTILSGIGFSVEKIDLTTRWFLDDFDTEFFATLMEEKLAEDFSFLKNKRFENLQDVCSEIEYNLPLEEEEISPIIKSCYRPKKLFRFDRQKD